VEEAQKKNEREQHIEKLMTKCKQETRDKMKRGTEKEEKGEEELR